jgi:selenide,water dikinase
MGGTPTLALNVAGWPVDVLPLEMLADVLRGGRAVADAARIAVVGGHTITTEKEPLYGLVAVGLVDLDALIRNTEARPGMSLVLTKPVGTGMITTAAKRGVAPDEQLRDAVGTMTSLNADASRIAVARKVRAGTDVTGFGLLGHAHEMADRSGVRLVLESESWPALDGALEVAQAGEKTGGDPRNREFAAAHIDADGVAEERLVLGFDPQTAGGLLVSLPAQKGPALVAELDSRGLFVQRIGRVEDGAGVVVV